MPSYVALLRAVNVGGTGKLPMSELRAMCERAGFAAVRTYIASGNVVFTSPLGAVRVKQQLEAALETFAGKRVAVLVRTAAEIREVLESNPFPSSETKHTVAIFLDEPPPADALAHMTGRKGEEVRLGRREIYVDYGGGMADSRLKIPAARDGTARNMNTVAALAKLATT